MNQRFYSLDVFRGATVALMILVNNPGDWSHIFAPLEHAPWDGCTPTDLVFPFFLFAVGNALSFVIPRMQAKGNAFFLRKVFTRTVLIMAIGIFLNWSPFVRWDEGHLVFRHWVNPSNPHTGIRVTGVLQRIALCYFFASLILYFLRPRAVAWISVGLLLTYWALTHYLGTGDPYSMAGYFGNPIDQSVLGEAHLYKGEKILFDPEGLMGAVTGTVSVIAGYLAGRFIREHEKTYEMIVRLLLAGCALVALGYFWHDGFPINKKIWSSSYVVYTSGLAMIAISFLLYAIEMRKRQSPAFKFFEVFGKNPLFIFVLSGFLPRVIALIRWPDHTGATGETHYTSFFPWFYETVCKPLFSDQRFSSLLYALIILLFYWAIAYWMDRRKLYIKV